MQAIRFHKKVDKNGMVSIAGLPYHKGDSVEIIVLRDESEMQKPKRRSLLDTGIIGMWKDRTDITASASFARQLRENSQSRRRF
jgi:hypothetical protein